MKKYKKGDVILVRASRKNRHYLVGDSLATVTREVSTELAGIKFIHVEGTNKEGLTITQVLRKKDIIDIVKEPIFAPIKEEPQLVGSATNYKEGDLLLVRGRYTHRLKDRTYATVVKAISNKTGFTEVRGVDKEGKAISQFITREDIVCIIEDFEEGDILLVRACPNNSHWLIDNFYAKVTEDRKYHDEFIQVEGVNNRAEIITQYLRVRDVISIVSTKAGNTKQ